MLHGAGRGEEKMPKIPHEKTLPKDISTISVTSPATQDFYVYELMNQTVDGRNPAPPMYKTLKIIGKTTNLKPSTVLLAPSMTLHQLGSSFSSFPTYQITPTLKPTGFPAFSPLASAPAGVGNRVRHGRRRLKPCVKAFNFEDPCR